MIVLADSSPLISLASIGRLELLRQLFQRIHIADEVREEVVARGAGRPGAEAVQRASWVEAHPALPPDELLALRTRHALGAGEIATVLVARALRAQLVIMDDRTARRLAQSSGLAVMGCVGILEAAFRRGLAPDLREDYRQLLAHGVWIDPQLLDESLARCGLQPL